MAVPVRPSTCAARHGSGRLAGGLPLGARHRPRRAARARRRARRPARRQTSRSPSSRYDDALGGAAAGVELHRAALSDVDFHARDGAARVDRQEAHLEENHAAVAGTGGHEARRTSNGKRRQPSRPRATAGSSRAQGRPCSGWRTDDRARRFDRVRVATEFVAAERPTLHRPLNGRFTQADSCPRARPTRREKAEAPRRR